MGFMMASVVNDEIKKTVRDTSLPPLAGESIDNLRDDTPLQTSGIWIRWP
jgi:hypothetical protein